MFRTRHAPSSRCLRVASLTATLIGLVGCVEVPNQPPPRPAAAVPVATGDPRLANVPEKDRVLAEYRLAATELRAGNFEAAKRQLDAALLRIGGLISGPDEAAKRARGLFNAEREKTFIGEPYERVMAFYYRGLLYWRDVMIARTRRSAFQAVWATRP